MNEGVKKIEIKRKKKYYEYMPADRHERDQVNEGRERDEVRRSMNRDITGSSPAETPLQFHNP